MGGLLASPDLIRIAEKLAQKHAIRESVGCEFDDLHQVALLALHQARDSYDGKRGPTFETYATSKMHQAVVDELRVKGPKTRRGTIRDRRATVEDFDGMLEVFRGPSVSEDEPVFPSLDPKFIASLSDKNRRMLLLASRGMNHREIAEQVGVTQSRVSQVFMDVRRKAERWEHQTLPHVETDKAEENGFRPWPTFHSTGPNYRTRGLTERERRVLEAAAEGLSAQQTADLYDVSVETIKTHRRRVIEKLAARNIMHSVTIAFRSGLIV